MHAITQLVHLESGFQPSFAHPEIHILLYFSWRDNVAWTKHPRELERAWYCFYKAQKLYYPLFGNTCQCDKRVFSKQGNNYAQNSGWHLTSGGWDGEEDKRGHQAVGSVLANTKFMRGSREFILLLCFLTYIRVIYGCHLSNIKIIQGESEVKKNQP